MKQFMFHYGLKAVLFVMHSYEVESDLVLTQDRKLITDCAQEEDLGVLRAHILRIFRCMCMHIIKGSSSSQCVPITVK